MLLSLNATMPSVTYRLEKVDEGSALYFFKASLITNATVNETKIMDEVASPIKIYLFDSYIHNPWFGVANSI